MNKYTLCYQISDATPEQLARVVAEIENEIGMTPIGVFDDNQILVEPETYLPGIADQD